MPLLNLPGVKEAAVIAETHLGANALVSFVVMKKGELFRPEALRCALRLVLPQWKVPAFIYPIDELPLTLTGKIDRQLLQQLYSVELMSIKCIEWSRRLRGNTINLVRSTQWASVRSDVRFWQPGALGQLRSVVFKSILQP